MKLKMSFTILVLLMLLLVPIGALVAQSSKSYVTQRFVTIGSSSVNSASYSVTSVIGQPVIDVVQSRSYKVSGGFLFAQQQATQSDIKIWLPLIQD